MKAWWSALSERDRRMLSIGGLVVAALLFWALWFDPLLQSRRNLADSVKQAEADLVYMQAASQRLAAMQSTGTATVFDRGGRSLLALADASAREAQLANVLKRIEPVSSGRVSVWLEAARSTRWRRGWNSCRTATAFVPRNFPCRGRSHPARSTRASCWSIQPHRGHR
jgi:general secretion pathway protein M